MKVALVYDRVNKWGGAERVLLALQSLFPEAPLFTSVYNKTGATWAKDFEVIPSFLQNLPLAASAHEFYPLLMPIAFEQFNFDEFDLVISVTSESAKGIITKPRTKHICYCLTPTRYLWSGYEEYFQNPLFRFLSRPAVAYLRSWEKVASSRPDKFIAISSTVATRIKKYYNRDSDVLFPPLMLNHTTSEKKLPEEKFFLVVSRLVSYKRIDLAIKACNKLGLPLKIVGTGSEEKKLRRLAGPTIQFLGSLTDDRLVQYYRQCTALIFPGNEDFGLTMVEAQSFGKPVVAFKEGGALDIIRDGKTGVFFTSKTVQSLTDAITEAEGKKWDPDVIMKNSERFALATFQKSFSEVLSRVLESRSA